MSESMVRSSGASLLLAIKEVNTPLANVGDVISYTITLTNQTNDNITNIRLTDIIDKVLQVENNSIGINGVVSSVQTLSMLQLPDLPPQGQHEVVFNTYIVRTPQGEDNFLRGTATAIFIYQGEEYEVQSTIAETIINLPDTALSFVTAQLTADKEEAMIGDIVRYILVIYPNGYFNILDGRLYLALDDSLRLLPGTVCINGKTPEICSESIKLPDLIFKGVDCVEPIVIGFQAIVESKPPTIRAFAAVGGVIQYYIEGECSPITTTIQEALVEVIS